MRVLAITIAFLVIGVLAPSISHAQETRIAVVDVQKLLSESKAAKDIQEQMNKEREKSQAEFSKYERELKEAEQQLVAERNSLTPEEFTHRREAFEQKLLDTRKLVQKRKRDLEEGFNQALAKLREEIIKDSTEVAKSEKYNLVLSKQYVVVLDGQADITSKVLALLDKNMPKLSMKVSGK